MKYRRSKTMPMKVRTNKRKTGYWRKSILAVHKEMARHNLKSKQATVSEYVR